MRITVEVDRNISKNEPPDIQIITIQEHCESLDEWLDVFKRLLIAMTFVVKGNLEVVDEEEF
jgi:hypothetical protein